MSNRFYNVLKTTDYELPLYIISSGYWENQPSISRDHGWRAFQWLFCQEGQGVLETREETATVSKGQGMLLYPDVPHRYWATEEPWTLHWVEYDGSLVKELLHALHLSESVVLYMAQPNIILSRLLEINGLFSLRKSVVPGHDSSQLMYNLLVDVARYGSRFHSDSAPPPYEKLGPVFSLIQSRYREPLTLDDMADSLLLSPQYICHLFQKAVGLSPIEYLNQYRISKAKELLIQFPERKIKTIAAETGFESPSYFNKLFRRYEEMTPLEFRRLHQS